MSGATIAIVAALVGSPVLGVFAAKYLRPNLTPREELEQVRADREEDRVALVNLRASHLRLADYVHQLRTHIAEEKGPPPPPWPEGTLQ